MEYFKEWRGYDIAKRCEKIERAVNLQEVRNAEDFPIVINAPCYFGFGDRNRSHNYWENPAVMVKFQEDGFEKHLSLVNDDTVPYFMPWFGTGVLASAFGCTYREAVGNGDDPALTSHCIETVKDIAHLKMPDPYKDGWMPRVLDTIDYARAHSDLPVGLTDMNSPLCTIAQMCGYEKLFIWMYEEPEAVHELFDIVTDAFINWTKIQKGHIGELLDMSNGLQGIWSPRGVGVWMSDDDIVSMSPDLYEEFIVPRYSRVFTAIGGGSLHFCGNASHQADNLLKIKNLRVVNNSTLFKLKEFGKMVKKLSGKVAIQVQDIAYADIRDYTIKLLNQIGDLKGVMIATFVLDNIAMVEGGGNVDIDRNAFETSNQIVSIVRECIGKKLAGEELI